MATSVLTIDRRVDWTSNPFDFQETIDMDQCSCVIDWDQIPGTMVRLGIQGQFVTDRSMQFRVRQGAIKPPNDPPNTSTIRITFAVDGTSNELHVSDFFVKPTGKSYINLTAQSNAGNGGSSIAKAVVITIESDVDFQGLLLVSAQANELTTPSEDLDKEWVVDFDKLGVGDTVAVTLACSALGAFSGTKRIHLRIGGTVATVDGTIVIDIDVRGFGAGHGRPISQTASIARPSGPQSVKMTMVTDAFNVDSQDVSVLFVLT